MADPSGVESFRSPIHGIAPKLTPPSASWLLLWSSLAFLGMFGASMLLELDEVVTATARIEPSGQVRHVQHFEGGTIQEVLVHEGSFVGVGDILVRLINTPKEPRIWRISAPAGRHSMPAPPA